jgi:hypothetical protein
MLLLLLTISKVPCSCLMCFYTCSFYALYLQLTWCQKHLEHIVVQYMATSEWCENGQLIKVDTTEYYETHTWNLVRHHDLQKICSHAQKHMGHLHIIYSWEVCGPEIVYMELCFNCTVPLLCIWHETVCTRLVNSPECFPYGKPLYTIFKFPQIPAFSSFCSMILFSNAKHNMNSPCIKGNLKTHTVTHVLLHHAVDYKHVCLLMDGPSCHCDTHLTICKVTPPPQLLERHHTCTIHSHYLCLWMFTGSTLDGSTHLFPCPLTQVVAISCIGTTYQHMTK